MADQAHDWTDEQIAELERRLRKEYAQAESEMRKRLVTFMADYDRKNDEWKAKVKSGEATQQQYDAWLRGKAADQTFLHNMVETLSIDANRTNQLAMEAISDSIPTIFAENANYATYEVESKIGRQYHSFDLYDRDTVRILIRDQPQLLPPLPNPRMDNGVDLRWNRQKFASAITQAVLQGESIPRAAERIGRVMRTNETAAIRAARTAITGAENAGRIQSYKRAKSLGIDIEQQWVATFDKRTRLSHRELHGQHVPVGSYFVAKKTTGNKLLFPGDPTAEPSEVYNCRCSLVAWSAEMEAEMGLEEEIWTDLEDGTTYSEWKVGKIHEAERKEAAGVVDGKDILATWKRRDGEFDFEIEDVINAQGFDGKPRIVDADEFDRAVKAANNGDGLIMQRVYSAPDQVTLDAYREELYDGKWYVDCSHGNDTYGKGMYTASSKSTSVTQQMSDEIAPYRREFSYTETMTLDPSARVIGYNDIVAAKNDASVLERAIVGTDDISDTELAIVRREVLREYSDEDRALARAAEREWDFDDYMAVIKEYSQREREFRELGTSEVAVLLGYDAIEVPGLNYTVVLNRTKLIIRRPE